MASPAPGITIDSKRHTPDACPIGIAQQCWEKRCLMASADSGALNSSTGAR